MQGGTTLDTFRAMHRDEFLRAKLRILGNTGHILDIGGGLRVSRDRGNRFDAERAAWILPLLNGCKYEIADPVDTYNPDIVADIHNMPFEDGSLTALICLSVFEHIENPFAAVSELYRVLKVDGSCLAWVPFLFPYHAAPGYYDDYWRFTEAGCRQLFKKFAAVEVQRTSGMVEAITHVTPFGRWSAFRKLSVALDRLVPRPHDNKSAGYYIFATK